MMTGLILGILGIVATIVGSTISNNMANQREKQARQENFQLNEMAAENADQRTRALYEDLQSPAAQRQQYEEAGLSPSLMFGGKWNGGQMSQGAQGEGASGISPTVFGVDGMDATSAANIAVQQAQARKLNAEADDLEGKTTESQARIAKLIAETGNTEMQTAYQSLENEWQQYENAIKGATATNDIALSDEQLKQGYALTDKLLGEAVKAQTEGEITKKTRDDVIQQVRDKTLKQQAEIVLIKGQANLASAKVKLSNAQVQNLLNEVIIRNEEVKLKGDEIEISRESLEKRVAQWAIENGFREKEQKIAITKTVIEGITGAGTAAGSIIKAVTPLGALTKVVGL